MNRKEQILDAAMTNSNYSCPTKAFIEGAFWADLNSKTGANQLLKKSSDMLSKFANREFYTPKEVYELLTELNEFLK